MSAPLTFLFTDLENSTSLWEQAPMAMQGALARHDAILRAAVEAHNGRTVKTTGDGLHAVFDSAVDAILAALAAQQGLSATVWPVETGPLRVRMGLHTGESEEREGDYYGPTVNQAARIMDMGHGGQVLLSEVTVLILRSQKIPGITFTDLGAHQLKGSAQPEVIYQLNHPDLVAEFPPLKSPSAPKHNLPAQLTPLIGRQDEITALSGMLLDPNLSLVSIVAPGGMGKTRLALELGRQLVKEFKHGVFFVELAPISDSGNIIPAVAEAIGYQFQQSGRGLKQQVLDYLENKQMLLILDNFEHLIAGGGELVTAMLTSASGLKILATSRQRLYQPGETLFTLPGLRLPNSDAADRASQYAAIELFQQAARRARPDFALTPENLPHIIRICQLVEGMPLGILLAAAWITVLSTAEIAEEIQRGLDILEAEGSELPERQRSIRAVFDQAWGMLAEAEQQVFMKLAVFRGGFSRQAGLEVAGAGLRELQILVTNALIDRDTVLGRYHVHELLRQYAGEKLHQSGQYQQIRDDHTRYFLTYLGEQPAGLKGAGQSTTLKFIQVDFENVRAGWENAVNNRNYALLGQALEGMYLFCFLQSRLEDGKALFDKARQGLAPEMGREPHPVWLALGIRFYRSADSQAVLKERLESALALARHRDDQPEAAFCLHTLGTLAHYVDQDAPRAIQYYEECAGLYRQLSEKYYLAQTLSKLGEAYQLMGQTELTFKYVQEAYQLQAEIGDQLGESESLRALAMTTYQTGDYDAMDDFIDKAFAIQIETNYVVGQAASNLYIGFMAFMRGEAAAGRQLVEKALGQALDVVDYSTQAWCHAMLSMMDSADGNFTDAQQELLQAQATVIDPFRQTGAGNPFLQLHIHLSGFLLETGSGNFEVAKHHLLQPLTLAIGTSSHPYMTIFLALAALIYAQEGRSEPATKLLGLSLSQTVKVTGWLRHWGVLNRVQSELQDELGQTTFKAAWDEGQSRDLKAAAEEVLQEIESSGV